MRERADVPAQSVFKTFPMSETEDVFELRLPAGSQIIRVRIVRSERARRMTLRVKSDASVSVVIPTNIRGNILEKAQIFALKNLDWIDRQVEKFSKNQSRFPDKSLSEYLREHPKIFADEHPLSVEISPTAIRPFFVFRPEESVLPIYVRADFLETDLQNALAGIAKIVLPKRLLQLSETCGVSVENITIRNQNGRWGSCTNRGNISLNWRIILLPPKLRDHVLLHELAHRRHMNHSDDFWDLLYAWDSETATRNRELQNAWSFLFRLRVSG